MRGRGNGAYRSSSLRLSAPLREIKGPPLILDYVSPSDHPRGLILKQGDGTVRVAFPVGPSWLYFTVIGLEAVAGLARAGMAIWMVLAMRPHSLTPWVH